MANVCRAMWFGLGLAVTVGLVVPSPGWAQAGRARKKDAAQPGMEIEEITVTAQKREESIQETPLAITAITSERLAEKGVSNVVELTEAVPNFRVINTTGSRSSLIISMRGTYLADNVLTQQPPVGLYIDGAYIAKINGANFDLEDLERVEALRGPQGTLFGRNTIGGAVNMITKKPSEERSIIASTQVGNYNDFKQRLTLNVPLVGKNGFFQSDALGTISLRENAVYHSHDGYYRNESPTSVKATGSKWLSDLNRVSTATSLRWEPRKDVTIDYMGEYHRYRNAGTPVQLTYLYPSGLAATALKLQPYVKTHRVDEIGSNSILDANLKPGRLADDGNHRMHILNAAWNLGDIGFLGNVTLKSISEYRSFFAQQDQDGDGTPLHYAEYHVQQEVDHWSEELQLVGTGPRLNYVGGFYYYGEHAKDVNNQVFFGGGSIFDYTLFVYTDSWAPFGQITWTPPILNDRLSLTAGIRYTKEQVHVHKFYRDSFGVHFDDSRGKAFGGTDAISPMGDISYQWTPELMTYFRVSRGFTSGGFNGRANNLTAFAQPFDPETLLAYEAGFKSQWLDNRIRLNANGFFSKYKDQQVLVSRLTENEGFLFFVQNAASSDIWGSEVEAQAIPLRGVEATLTYSYLHPKYNEFIQELPVNGVPTRVDVADETQVPPYSEHSFTAGLTYTAPPTTHGTFSAHIDTYWADRIKFLRTKNFQPDRQSNYFIWNGRLQFTGIPLQKGTLDLAVYGRNLFQQSYRTLGVDYGSQLGWVEDLYGDPRTFGLQLTYSFTAGDAVPPPPPPVAQAAPPPPPAKKKIVLRSVHFDFDKATLKADAKPILDEAVQVLKQEGSVDIIVEGHTDSVGTEQYNLGLSRRRAETVRTYLVEHGIVRSRITAEGLGESKPVASNDTADGRAQNRRVELHVK